MLANSLKFAPLAVKGVEALVNLGQQAHKAHQANQRRKANSGNRMVRDARRSMPQGRAVPLRFNTTTRTNIPRFSMSNTDGLTIKHKELSFPVTNSSATYNCIGRQCNPGVSISFPWLSSIAGSFEQYNIRNMTLEWNSRLSGTEPGSIMLAAVPDAYNANPVDQTAFMSIQGAFIGSVTSPAKINITPRLVNRQLYTRTTRIEDVDLKTYDAGRYLVGAEGVTATGTIGTISIGYDIILHNAKENTDASQAITAYATAGLSANNIFGTNGITIGTFTFTNDKPWVDDPEYKWFLGRGYFLVHATCIGTGLGLMTLSSCTKIYNSTSADGTMSNFVGFMRLDGTVGSGGVHATIAATTMTSSYFSVSPWRNNN